jgi:hypothetical protein
MPTHGLLVTGTGGTTADSRTQIGSNIVLPAGGPWIIHGVWSLIAKDTTVPNEGDGGVLELNSFSGDLDPDPAPGLFPLIGPCISESANSAISANPLQFWKTRLTAAGKAVVQFFYLNDQALTTGSDIAAGIIFGDNEPEERPIVFVDSVQDEWAAATENTIGTITLSEKATRITGILADVNKVDAATAGEPCLVTVRLKSDDIMLPPAQYPGSRAFNASDGTAVGQSSTPLARFIPLDIPVTGGSRIDVYGTSTASVTGNCSCRVFIMYE